MLQPAASRSAVLPSRKVQKTVVQNATFRQQVKRHQDTVRFCGQDATRPVDTVFMSSTDLNRGILKEMAAIADKVGFKLKIIDRVGVWDSKKFFGESAQYKSSDLSYPWMQEQINFLNDRALVVRPSEWRVGMSVFNQYFHKICKQWLPHAVDKPAVMTQSGIYGDNFYQAKNQEGQTLYLIGEDVVTRTTAQLQQQLSEDASEADALDCIASDLQTKPESLVCIPNRLEAGQLLFHTLDLMLNPLKDGKILLQSFRATDAMLQDTSKDIWQKLDTTADPSLQKQLLLLEGLVDAMKASNAKLEEQYGPMLKATATKLTEKGFQVLQMPGVIGNFQYNFLNGIAHENHLITNDSDILAIQALSRDGTKVLDIYQKPQKKALDAFDLQIGNREVADFVKQVMGRDVDLDITTLGKRTSRLSGKTTFDEYCQKTLKQRCPSLNTLFEAAGVRTFNERFKEVLLKSDAGIDSVFFVKGALKSNPAGEAYNLLNENHGGLHNLVTEYRP